MEFKGTKGFWRTREHFDEKYNQPTIEIDCGEDTLSLATIWSGNRENAEICEVVKADALLISKAPEMLRLLRLIVDDYENTGKSSESILLDFLKSAKQLIKESTEI